MIDLSEHGSACRCLLRLHENSGKPWISDADFVSRHIDAYPDWKYQPGEADDDRLREIAAELKLADAIAVCADYDLVLAEHRAGRAVLVRTERLPTQDPTKQREAEQVMLLEAMDETGFSVWWPYVDGQADSLAAVPRRWWGEWRASGLILKRALTAARVPVGASKRKYVF